MPGPFDAQRRTIVIMGVSGSGKSSFGILLAGELGLDFVDGDSLHSPANIVKMHAGIALTDEDRGPWLDAIGATLADKQSRPNGVVVACSALRRAYRDHIRSFGKITRFVYLATNIETARRRVSNRTGHFMSPALVDDQFATLEPPASDEQDVVTLDSTLSLVKLAAMEMADLARTEQGVRS